MLDDTRAGSEPGLAGAFPKEVFNVLSYSLLVWLQVATLAVHRGSHTNVTAVALAKALWKKHRSTWKQSCVRMPRAQRRLGHVMQGGPSELRGLHQLLDEHAYNVVAALCMFCRNSLQQARDGVLVSAKADCSAEIWVRGAALVSSAYGMLMRSNSVRQLVGLWSQGLWTTHMLPLVDCVVATQPMLQLSAWIDQATGGPPTEQGRKQRLAINTPENLSRLSDIVLHAFGCDKKFLQVSVLHYIPAQCCNGV